MKRTPLERKTPLTAKTGLRRTTPLQQSSAGIQPGARASLTRKAPMRTSAPRDPGPSGAVVEAVLERDRYSCLRCGYGIGPNERGRRWSLHHRLRRAQGPDHTPQNLILLCGGSEAGGCHGFVHANPEESRAAGWLLRGRMEPLAVPVWIPLEDRRVQLTATGLYHRVREAS